MPGWLSLHDIIAVLDEERSVNDLRRYFAPGRESLTGSQFETLGADRAALNRDVVTAEDLVAVQLLNVRVPPAVALELLQGDLGQQISDELRKLPLSVELSEEAARPYIEDCGPASRAWQMLRECHGVNKAIAGKLLARKRPKLLPVYDNVVACALHGRRGFWLWLHEQLRAENLLLTERLRKLRDDSGIPAHVSDIRVLDIVIWMRHKGDHRRRGCPGLPRNGPSL